MHHKALSAALTCLGAAAALCVSIERCEAGGMHSPAAASGTAATAKALHRGNHAVTAPSSPALLLGDASLDARQAAAILRREKLTSAAKGLNWVHNGGNVGTAESLQHLGRLLDASRASQAKPNGTSEPAQSTAAALQALLARVGKDPALNALLKDPKARSRLMRSCAPLAKAVLGHISKDPKLLAAMQRAKSAEDLLRSCGPLVNAVLGRIRKDPKLAAAAKEAVAGIGQGPSSDALLGALLDSIGKDPKLAAALASLAAGPGGQGLIAKQNTATPASARPSIIIKYAPAPAKARALRKSPRGTATANQPNTPASHPPKIQPPPSRNAKPSPNLPRVVRID